MTDPLHSSCKLYCFDWLSYEIIVKRRLNITLSKQQVPADLGCCSECINGMPTNQFGEKIPCIGAIQRELKKSRTRQERYNLHSTLMDDYGINMLQRRRRDIQNIGWNIDCMNKKRKKFGRSAVAVAMDLYSFRLTEVKSEPNVYHPQGYPIIQSVPQILNMDYYRFLLRKDLSPDYKVQQFNALRQAVKDGKLNITLSKQPSDGPFGCSECTNPVYWQKFAVQAIRCICTIEREIAKSRSRQERYGRFSPLITAYGINMLQRQLADKNKIAGTVKNMNNRRFQVRLQAVADPEDLLMFGLRKAKSEFNLGAPGQGYAFPQGISQMGCGSYPYYIQQPVDPLTQLMTDLSLNR